MIAYGRAGERYLALSEGWGDGTAVWHKPFTVFWVDISRGHCSGSNWAVSVPSDVLEPRTLKMSCVEQAEPYGSDAE